MPIGSPIATTEPKATSRITIAATRPRISPIPVSASANAKNRSPRISTRNGESAAAVAPYASIRCRSEGSSRSTTGYCTSITATLPSGDSVGAPALTTCGSAAAPARTADRAAAASGEASVAPGSFGVSTSCMVSPARADAVDVSSSVAWWESVPGTAKESSSFFPTALLAASTTTTSSNQAPMTCHGWRAASRPQRWRACDNMVTPSKIRGTPVGRRPAHRHEQRGWRHRPWGSCRPGRSTGCGVVFSADVAAPGFTRLGG